MKRGFTLVEIILSIGLIVAVGTVSIVSFNLIKKNNKEKTLESMSETIYNAVNVYLESNSDIKNELYTNKNGLKIPLTTLENSGLVDFGSLSDDLDDEDFVVTMLGSTDPDDDTCANTYTAKSWNITSGETIYICEKSNGSQNLVTVAGDADNLSKATRERFYFRGSNPLNYIQLKGDTSKTYRILYVDKDDTLTLINDGTFNGKFDGKTMSQSCYTDTTLYAYCNVNNDKLYYKAASSTISNTECKVGAVDAINTTECTLNYGFHYDETYNRASYSTGTGYNYYPYYYAWAVMTDKYNIFGWGGTPTIDENKITMNSDSTSYKIHLNSCMKITSGTGDKATPYIMEYVCS